MNDIICVIMEDQNSIIIIFETPVVKLNIIIV